jgi:hypothetical protein
MGVQRLAALFMIPFNFEVGDILGHGICPSE